MPKYTVYLSKGVEISVPVEADDVDDAIDKAFEVVVPGLCVHCSGWGKTWNRDEADDMEPSAVIDEVDGKTVWEAKSEAAALKGENQ